MGVAVRVEGAPCHLSLLLGGPFLERQTRQEESHKSDRKMRKRRKGKNCDGISNLCWNQKRLHSSLVENLDSTQRMLNLEIAKVEYK